MPSLIKHSIHSMLQTRGAKLLPGVAKAFLKAWVNEPVYPLTMQMEPTRRCNLRCVMCALTQFYHKERVSDMTFEEFKYIVSQLPRETERITLQGTGEPLLNKDIIKMIEYARALGLRTHFNTNLLPLTDEMAERLVAVGHDEIMVSIETTNPQRYADIRRGGAIEKFLDNLGKIKKERERLGVDHPTITACCILMRHTLQDIPALVATLKSYGVVSMHIADLCTYPEYSGPLTLADGSDLREQSLSATMPEKQVWEEINKIKALADSSFEITAPGDWGGLKIEKPKDGTVLTCRELWKIPFVKPDSTLATCCWAPQFVMGDFKTHTFNEIWFGKTYMDMRRKHLTNRHPEHCLQCQQLMYTVASPSRLFGPSMPEKPVDHVFLGCNAPPCPSLTDQNGAR